MILNLKENIDIKNLSWFRTEAKAKYYFEINTNEDVKSLYELWRFCEEKNLGMLFVGKWSNIFFAFEEFNWVVIRNKLSWWDFDSEKKELTAFSWELISNIAFNLKANYDENIWERFIWLPGTIWWAIFGNAGCFWLEAESNFLEAEVYNIETWQIEKFNKKDSQFKYRNSIFKEKLNKYFIIKVKFDLSKVVEKYNTNIDVLAFRKQWQPIWFSCGSFFQNPSKEKSAWKLIEEVGLKWYKLWWAFFSEKHANFLMSDWTANYKELLELMNLAVKKVKEEKQEDLKTEVMIIKNKE